MYLCGVYNLYNNDGVQTQQLVRVGTREGICLCWKLEGCCTFSELSRTTLLIAHKDVLATVVYKLISGVKKRGAVLRSAASMINESEEDHAFTRGM